jgi:flagellar motor switch protein FliM
MEKILSQEEIDALFRAAQTQMAAFHPRGPATRSFTVCNFRQAARITKDQLRSVGVLHETFARNLTHSLGAYLRVAFEVNLVSAEQLSYGEFLQRIPEVTYLVSMVLRPLDVLVAIEIDLPLAFPIIDLLLGGPGRSEAAVREVTEIEEQILDSVVKVIGRELESTWHAVLDVQFVFDQRLRQADIARLMPPNEKVLSLSFEIRMPEARGTLNVAFPAAVSNALVRKLNQQASYRRQRGTVDSSNQIRKHLEVCPFLVELLLPEGRVPIGQLLSLDPGQVLVLPRRLTEPADFVISGKKLFSAHPVRCGTRRGVRLLQRLQNPNPDRKENS